MHFKLKQYSNPFYGFGVKDPIFSPMERKRILLVEDDDLFRQALSESLKLEYEVDSTRDAEAALVKLAQLKYDLILTDVRMPGMDGFKFCASLKANTNNSNVAVIFLSGHADVEDKLIGFSVGASDFMLKPCDSREIKARIKIQLQERAKAEFKTLNYEVGAFRVDVTRQKIFHAEAGEPHLLDLSSLEFKLLHFLLTHLDHVLTRSQLLDSVWGEGCHVNDRSVDAVISKLRRKLGSHGRLLQAIRGEGYRFARPGEISTIYKRTA